MVATVIEPLFIDPNGSTEEREKINELVMGFNRLEELAKLNLGTLAERSPETDQQFIANHSENALTWPKDSRSAKGIERDIKRREKP